MLVPAMGMPLLSLSSTGLLRDVSLTEAVLALGNSGYWEVAALVAVCAQAAPFLNLWLVFTVSTVLQLGGSPAWLPRLLRLNHHVRVGHAGSVLAGGVGVDSQTKRYGAVATRCWAVLFCLPDAVYIAHGDADRPA
ncbi:MAG: paraquat-inducible protein A [Cellvibrionales bacterium]|nr:paraquat-inducible protein A [Cellvibrionales bacterium]